MSDLLPNYKLKPFQSSLKIRNRYGLGNIHPTPHCYAEHSSMTVSFYSVCNNLKVMICQRKN